MIMYIPLLQSKYYSTQTDWQNMAIMGGIILVLIMSLILYNKASMGPSRGRNGKKFSRRAFRREAAAIGLTKYQTRLLENIIRTYKVRRPFNLLSNTRDSNVTLGKALRDIDHMEAKTSVKEQRKLELYRIKQRIDRIFADTNRMASTRQLRLGQNVTFQQENGNRFTSIITANLKEFYCAQVPLNYGGEQVKWRKGTKIKLFIWGVDNEEMVFESKVLGYTNVKKITSVMLGHTNRINRAIQRRYRRRPIKGNCLFFAVRIIEQKQGRKIKRQAVVLKEQHLGHMIDLSPGGCAFSTQRPLPRGELIKVIFEPERGNQVVAYGKIVDSRLITRSKTILHIMFTQASSQNLNKINDYVYSFE
ncbi:MAG: hypothetical protein CSA76_02785 [Spirochaetales bacterium]|nr:MAG: hypothetical protein CSA76_02785 [Spirochaetales bacterium]